MGRLSSLRMHNQKIHAYVANKRNGFSTGCALSASNANLCTRAIYKLSYVSLICSSCYTLLDTCLKSNFFSFNFTM